MKQTRLAARLRDEFGKGPVGRLRRGGRVPGVVYGHGDETRSVSLDAHEIERLFAQVAVESTILELDVEGDKPVRALVRDVQRHPHRGDILHVDFYCVHAGEAISLNVPLRLVGAPPGVQEGGMTQQVIHEIAVRCAPELIPEVVELDISGLGIGDSLHVRDLRLPKGVILEIDEDRTVCSVVSPTVIEVEVEAEEEVPAVDEGEPELIRRRPDEAGEPAEADKGDDGSSE